LLFILLRLGCLLFSGGEWEGGIKRTVFIWEGERRKKRTGREALLELYSHTEKRKRKKRREDHRFVLIFDKNKESEDSITIVFYQDC